MSAVARGLRNPFRNRVRTVVVVLLLALIIGLFAVMVQGSSQSREQLGSLQTNVRTLVELREAGAFGTGGFGGDKPVGAEDFSVGTIERVKQIPHAEHITRIEEYVHQPEVDPAYPNAYTMIIGLRPGAPMRAIGEVDYENARIIAGRGLGPEDEGKDVVVIGRLYAEERAGMAGDVSDASLAGKQITLKGQALQVVGIYATGNDFGDNHVFVPLQTFRRIYNPGDKLSKIRVTVDSVANVPAVVEDLKQIPEVDAVTASEQVSTATAALGSIAAATFYGSLLLFIIGGVLVVFVMVLSTKERIREIGTLKAIGASNVEIVTQFLAEVVALIALAAVGAVIVAALGGNVLEPALGITLSLNRTTFLFIAIGGFVFAATGSLYPIVKAVRLSPVQAMRNT